MDMTKAQILKQFAKDGEKQEETELRLLRVAAGRLKALGKHGSKVKRALAGDKKVKFEMRKNPWAQSQIVKHKPEAKAEAKS